ncbi:hypothetical protein C9994_12835 [Marivirga lumbricoides]|uniref:RHS repeat-associated core domain-containing protein n=1 Tax=Marivirga lumbricoides TaxID=1046115 RepID=A0A2T4DIS2_9BACT|nr:hypothetical protein C9994_12835 [Marivirga lumbricoides]
MRTHLILSKWQERPSLSSGTIVYDYGFRIYHHTIGKFLSVDPLTNEYPWYTPYQFAGNMPINAIDLDGLEWVLKIYSPDVSSKFNKAVKAKEVDYYRLNPLC